MRAAPNEFFSASTYVIENEVPSKSVGSYCSRLNKTARTLQNVTASRFGLAIRRKAGKQKDLGSIPLRLSFFFKSCNLQTVSSDFALTINETLKWLSSLPILMQESFWW